MPEVQVEPEWFPPEGRPGKASCGLSLLEKSGQITRSVGLSPTNNGQTTYNRTLLPTVSIFCPCPTYDPPEKAR